MKSIYLFRHGETDFNREGRFQGHLDVPLNETGRQQARELGQRLREHSAPIGIQAMISSDLSRARETAEIVASVLEFKEGIQFTAELREGNLGDVQGMRWEEIEAKVGRTVMERFRSCKPSDADVSYPGGESSQSVVERTLSALEEALQRERAQIWAVSSHGGVIRRLMHRLLPEGAAPVRIPNAVVYRLEFDEKSRIWHVPSSDPLF